VRHVHAPTAAGIGTGKAFFFLFGYKRLSPRDQEMLAEELVHIHDDVDVLRGAGYTVVVDPQATHEDFLATVTGRGAGAEGLIPAGFYWSAHGSSDGSLECCDGAVVRPGDIDPETVAPGLRLAVFGACYVGAHSRTWRRALGERAMVVGWGRPVTLQRAVDFLEPDRGTHTDLDDLIQTWLLTDTPVPPDPTGTELVSSASQNRRIGELAERLPNIAEMLHAAWVSDETGALLQVPLPGERRHTVQVFVVEAAQPFSEGVLLCGMEAEVGEISALVTAEVLLAGSGAPGFGRVVLVQGATEMPRIVTQSFVPFAEVTDRELAAHCYQVALQADDLENAVFGSDD